MSAANGDAAGFLRRLGAFVYDALLLTAVLMVVTALLLPFTHGEAITQKSSGAFKPLYQFILLLVCILYFGFAWTRSGQTLGMRAWRIRTVRADGAPLRWTDVLIRFAAAALAWPPCGAGVLWMLVDAQKLALQDRLSKTRVIATSFH